MRLTIGHYKNSVVGFFLTRLQPEAETKTTVVYILHFSYSNRSLSPHMVIHRNITYSHATPAQAQGTECG